MSARRRPRFKPVRERNPIAVCLAGLALMALLAGVAYSAGDLPVVGGGTTYTADFTEAAGLRPGNEVRVAGVKVGKVTGVRLEGAKVKVSFRVKDTWVGNSSTAVIAIKTLLGDKYLALDPLGTGPQDPDVRIPSTRTTSPYDVTKALGDLAVTAGRLDSAQVAQSLQVISQTFARTPPSVRRALTGLSALSQTIASRDAELARLLAGTKELSGTLAAQNAQFETLLKDGNLLLAELRRRRDAIGGLLVGTRDLATEIAGLVRDNSERLGPMLRELAEVSDLLLRNQRDLDRALALAGPYNRLVGNTLGNGRWMDGYLCGVVPKHYLPPGTPPANGCMPPRQGGR